MIIFLIILIGAITSFFILKNNGFFGLLKFIIKYSSPLAILILNLTGFTIIGFIGSAFNIAKINTFSGSTRVAVDCAIITLIFNFIAQAVNVPGKISVVFNNKLDMDQILLKQDRRVKLEICVDIDYKYTWIKKVISNHGGLQLEIINTNWTSIEIDRREEYESIIDYTNPSKKIIVDLNDINIESCLDGKLYLTLIVESNKRIKNDGVIATKIIQKRPSFIKNIVFNTFVDTFCGNQKLSYREEVE